MELKRIMLCIDEWQYGDVEDEVFMEVLKAVDMDGDGFINFEELVRILISKDKKK